ncbi:hypothetical protein [Amycolatopsis sp. cmx-11-51]
MTAGTEDLERGATELPDAPHDRIMPANEIRLAAERAGREWEQPETD